MSDFEYLLFPEFRSENLEPDREFDDSSVFRERISDREGKSWKSGKAPVHREYVGKVHLEGIVRFFPDSPRDRRSSGRDDDIHLLKGLSEVVFDEFPDKGCPTVIGVVEPGGKDE